MPSIKLTAEETKRRFGVSKAIDNFPSSLTKQEEANVKVVLEYMDVSIFERLKIDLLMTDVPILP